VVIRVAAAGVNYPDLFQRRGKYDPPPGHSAVPGLEVSGVVAALGDGVAGCNPGDRVVALCNGGGYAEYVAVPAGQVLPLPRVGRLSPVDGSSFGTWVMLVVGRPFLRMSRVDYLERLDALMDVQAGPRPRAAFDGESELRWLDRQVLSTSGLERAIETGDLFMSALGATELGVALRRYRLDHGAYPGDLSAVVPAYLPDVPIDPFTGQPPVYLRQGDGFTLRAEGGRADRAASPALNWAVVR
jgi:hypothetical protein